MRSWLSSAPLDTHLRLLFCFDTFVQHRGNYYLRFTVFLNMIGHFVGLLTLALLWSLPALLDAYVTQNTGCHHNGTWYADKSLVPTMEKCLNCQCNKKTLVCRLKVCPEMPMPPPRGCVVVQKRNICCPYLSCARLDAFYKIPTTRRIIAYLDHYERESIDRVVNENVLQRRSDDSEVDLYVCVKNGTVYKSGSAMSSSNLCTYCYCIGGTEKCVKPKCMLPVEGCKPIFVDSTCCPVRYDCNAKPAGKSSQEVRYRKTSNKHFLRMSQRLQRNRGCTVGRQFYAEGQKLKSDPDKPCDLCFCIRGTRRCAPKKCAPALKNCIPVVPKGQCCPSSYDCGSQRDYRRAQSSRQFNLFSLLFGKDENGAANGTEIPEHYPHDRDPLLSAEHAVSSTNDKSFFDTIREGLEFIDSNNAQMLTDNNIVALQSPQSATIVETSTAVPEDAVSSTTEVSFLDLLLGPSDSLNNEANNVDDDVPEEKTTAGYGGLSWVDLLLGPGEDEEKKVPGTTISDKLDSAETTTNVLTDYDTTNIDRVDNNFDDMPGSGEIAVGEMPEEQQINLYTTNFETETTTEVGTTLETTENSLQEQTTESMQITSTTEDDRVESTTQALVTEKAAIKHLPTPKAVNKVNKTITTTTTIKPVKKISTTLTPKKTTVTATAKPVMMLHKTDSLPLNETGQTLTNGASHKPEKRNDLLTVLLDGISDMLSAEKLRNKTANKTNKPQITGKTTTTKKPIVQTLPTPTQLPLFKPLPTNKPYTRINSKITNLTLHPPIMTTKHAQNITFKPLPQLEAKLPSLTITNHSTSSTVPTKTPNTDPIILITSTVKPLVIKTNPTILEAEPLDNNAEPTLPPSLPNLKIIPFLPTDAVKADRNKPHYEFFHNNPTGDKMDYDLYEDANLYPSITERYPTYTDLEDGSKAEYIYKFNIEGPETSASPTSGKLEGTATYLKYDFRGSGLQTAGFSPPTKTEGGFMPKEPLIIDDDVVQRDGDEGLQLQNAYQVTKHIIDITTAEPMIKNTIKVIEITTPDPFKDVIKTETPPDLTSLIVDKEKNQLAKHNIPQNTEIKATILNHNLPISNKKLGPNKVTEATPYPSAFSSNHNLIEDKEPPLNRTTLENLRKQDKTSIETILDLLLKEEDDGTALHPQASLTTTIVPPFKALPQVVIKQLSTELPTITTTASRTATTMTTTTKATPTNRPTLQPARTKTTDTTVTTKPKPTMTISTEKSSMTTSSPPTTKPKIITAAIASSTASSSTASSSTIPSTSTTTLNPFLMSPFDKLPFMDASFEVKPHTPTPPKSNANNLLGLVHYKNSLNRFEGLEPAYENYPHPPNMDNTSAKSSPVAAAAPTTTTTTNIQHGSSNSLIDPTGLLKLAGCNIYGRMYRVGRIILELSSPCLECKCTEVGVKCGPLDC